MEECVLFTTVFQIQIVSKMAIARIIAHWPWMTIDGGFCSCHYSTYAAQLFADVFKFLWTMSKKYKDGVHCFAIRRIFSRPIFFITNVQMDGRTALSQPWNYDPRRLAQLRTFGKRLFKQYVPFKRTNRIMKDCWSTFVNFSVYHKTSAGNLFSQRISQSTIVSILTDASHSHLTFDWSQNSYFDESEGRN